MSIRDSCQRWGLAIAHPAPAPTVRRQGRARRGRGAWAQLSDPNPVPASGRSMTQNPARRGNKQSWCGGGAFGLVGPTGRSKRQRTRNRAGRQAGRCQRSSEVGDDEVVFLNASIEGAPAGGAILERLGSWSGLRCKGFAAHLHTSCDAVSASRPAACNGRGPASHPRSHRACGRANRRSRRGTSFRSARAAASAALHLPRPRLRSRNSARL